MKLQRYKQFLKPILLASTLLLTSCGQNSFIIKTKNQLFNKNASTTFITKSIEITASCNKDNIQSYLDKGWEIMHSSEVEVTCTWKTAKASKKCNIKKDKGCLITVPDMMGIKTTYTLNKRVKIDKDTK